jgi:hypothetical protein
MKGSTERMKKHAPKTAKTAGICLKTCGTVILDLRVEHLR